MSRWWLTLTRYCRQIYIPQFKISMKSENQSSVFSGVAQI